MPKAYLYLIVAIVTEVIGTSALKASDDFSKLIPSILVVLGYGVSFRMLSLVVREIPVGVSYAIWSGAGILLVSLVGMVLYKQIPDLAAWAGFGLIIAGIVVLNLFSKMNAH